MIITRNGFMITTTITIMTSGHPIHSSVRFLSVGSSGRRVLLRMQNMTAIEPCLLWGNPRVSSNEFLLLGSTLVVNYCRILESFMNHLVALDWSSYGYNVTYVDGSHAPVATRERPKLIFDEHTKEPACVYICIHTHTHIYMCTLVLIGR
jgi:hypothetical protein